MPQHRRLPDGIVLPLLTAGLFVGAWQAVAAAGFFPNSLLPSPLDVARGLAELGRQGVLFEHIATSLYRFAAGYGLAVALGIPAGLALGWYTRLGVAFDPLIQVLRPISPIAWIPLAILWFGTGDRPAIFIIFLASLFPIVLSTAAAVRHVDPLLIRMARNFGASERQLLSSIVFPSAFPHIAVGLHVALGTAWIHLVAGEVIAVRSGLGYLIVDGRNLLRTDLVVAAMLIIGLLGFGLDRLMRLAEGGLARRGLGAANGEGWG